MASTSSSRRPMKKTTEEEIQCVRNSIALGYNCMDKRLMLKYGKVHKNLTSNGNLLLLNCLCVNEDLKMIKFLINKCEWDASLGDDFAGCNTLHYAAMKGAETVCRFLVEKGVDVNSSNSTNHSPLHYAAFQGNMKIVEMLLDAKAAVNSQTITCRTPLCAAIDGQKLDVMKELCVRGADVNIEFDGINPLLLCISLAYCDGLSFLLEVNKQAGVVSDARKLGFPTLLEVATVWGNPDIVTKLIEFGVNPLSCTLANNFPQLASAAFFGKREIVEVLMSHIDTEDQGVEPWTLQAIMSRYANDETIRRATHEVKLVKTIEGDALMAAEQYLEALPEFSKILYIYGEEALNMAKLAICYSKVGEMIKAKQIAKKAVKASERCDKFTQAMAFSALGSAMESCKDFKLASEWYSAAVNIDGNNPQHSLNVERIQKITRT